MIEIPWNGPSVIVPAEALEVLHKFNHNYNHVPLIQCLECEFGRGVEQCGCLLFLAVNKDFDMKNPKGFCSLAKRANACQKTDNETAARADAEILEDPVKAWQKRILELGC